MSQPIRSVHLTNYYHKSSGGISTSYNNLLAAAERHRRYVRLIVPGETEAVEDVNEFARIYYIPAKQSPVFDKRYRIIMPWQYMPGDSKIREIMLAERPDLVEVTDKYTLSMMGAMIRVGKFKQLGRPMLVHFSAERMDDNIGSFLTSGGGGRWFARRVIANYTLPVFDYHIANSVYTAQEFHDAVDLGLNPKLSKKLFNAAWRRFAAPRVPIAERIHVAPRGVNSAQFSPERRSREIRAEMISRAGIPEDAAVLLYAGRISPEKNIGLLVEMMEILAADTSRDYRLVVAGDGPQAEWLREQGERRAKGKIVLLGHLDKEMLAGYYANADVFVHPNPREPFGIAPLEAMASGVPTLAPNSGGILSYATNDNAWLVEPDARAFSEAVREIVGSDSLREKKIANALAAARANTREASTDRLLATYDKLYEDFQRRRELFTDIEAAKRFDYARLLK
ncbi:MAG: glycosyltransferase [Pyrinomonadaceae bacterium]